ncbi:uncharacterized protein LOC120341423 [Styela clava]|uniref:uncharacterized protein LOC120341423 n=1 Tax=Styela clava TaxID=7725 RepID=UPI00193A58F3|nr:uncharacterized protein LOC120341423 [Styela clava]
MGILRLGSGGGLVFALIFDIIALSTPGWIYVNPSSCTNCDYAQGLFQNVSGNTTTETIRGDAEKVAISFQIMGDVILICAAIALCIGGGKKGQEVVGKVGGVLSFVAGIFIMIGVASYTGLYASFVEEKNVDWGYSFAFAWTASCICIIAAPLAFIDK